MPVAIEEFLRFYAPVTMARLVKHDMEYQGCPMKEDDWILLGFPAANRDPVAFKTPTSSSSIERRIVTSPLDWAYTAAPDRTWPVSRCASRSRSSSSAIPLRIGRFEAVTWAPVRFAGRGTCRFEFCSREVGRERRR